MNIHREGKQLLSALFFVLFIVNFCVFYYFDGIDLTSRIIQSISLGISVLVYGFFLQFFRNPQVNTEINHNHIIAPADGKIVVIEEVEENEFLKEKCIQVSIFMSPLNVHVNRYPITGTVSYVKYHPGKFLVAWHPKSSTENERTTVAMESINGIRLVIRQIAGAVARRIVTYSKENQRVLQGAELGFIKFGSRVDVFLPIGSEIKVKIGDKTKGGKTVLADIEKIAPKKVKMA